MEIPPFRDNLLQPGASVTPVFQLQKASPRPQQAGEHGDDWVYSTDFSASAILIFSKRKYSRKSTAQATAMVSTIAST